MCEYLTDATNRSLSVSTLFWGISLDHADGYRQEKYILYQEEVGDQYAIGHFPHVGGREQKAQCRQEYGTGRETRIERYLPVLEPNQNTDSDKDLGQADQVRYRLYRYHVIEPTHGEMVLDQRLNEIRFRGSEFVDS